MMRGLARVIGGRVPWAMWQLGLDLPEDRKVLERIILPSYRARVEVSRILFVGVASYVRHYATLFPHQLFITIDRSPSRARYGGPHHIMDDVLNLELYFRPGFFDVIVMNGVIGWGLDDLPVVDRALAVLHRQLRAGGELVLSTDESKPCHGELDRLEALRGGFSPWAPFGAPSLVTRVPWQARPDHVFFFYRRLP